MQSGYWKTVLDVSADQPLTTRSGLVMGIPMDAGQRAKALEGATTAERAAADRFAATVHRWQKVRDVIASISSSGVSVVSPAGDVGPGLQTVLGVANLPEVISVGGFDGRAVSASSASGPSIDGSVKPDLIAPSGIVGVLPESSALAKSLGAAGVLSPSLSPLWDAGDAPSRARARLDSSLTSATLVAAATGGMSREGLRDAAAHRGALTAASVPLSGTPAWRQGAGLLKGVPTAEFASSRPLVTQHADLGAEPESGAWSAVLAVRQGRATAASSVLSSFAGSGPAGATKSREVSPANAPPVAARVSERGAELSVPLGASRYDGGLYCGYTDVDVIGTGGSVRPGVSIDGVPPGTEQVPTCLVKGSRVRGHGFYIHDIPAENLTFALLPALPPEASLLTKPLMLLPVNPLHTKLFFKVTGADGNADFSNVPPGYYTVRQFSDYGSPVVQTLTDSASGAEVTRTSDLGENPSYQDFDALILGSNFTETDLRDTFGPQNVQADPPTNSWLVTTGPRTTRVILDRFKKMPGVAVSSRVVDLMGHDDLDFASSPLAGILRLPALAKLPLAGDMRGWTFTKGGPGTDAFTATFNPVASAGAAASVVGVAKYPFALTTPNYKMHMSLNFSYDLTNAAVLAVVNVGEEWAAGVVTPAGTLRSPTVGTTSPVGSGGIAVSGAASGLANFEFDMKPLGDNQGDLYLILVPSRPVQQLSAPLTSASIGDLSVNYDTWQRTSWPAANTPHGRGHAFDMNPNYSASQMSADACRRIDSGGVKADVCEDWQVLVHSPGDDAATVDVAGFDGSKIPAIRSGGSRYADPARGTRDFSATLAFSLPQAEAPVSGGFRIDNAFRTNGRFWEQLALSRKTLAAISGPVEVQILDNLRGRSSQLAGHIAGPVPVAAYVPFASGKTDIDPLRLVVAGAQSQTAPLAGAVAGATQPVLGPAGAGPSSASGSGPAASPAPQAGADATLRSIRKKLGR
ncbi:MAG TPA: hypothetical protein VNE62_03195, partial [Actinomycetota bacterium]|nr:hypothetical protein [Actinomycetota bacterium]